MADITLLHWNIQQLSDNKVDNPVNGAALINYIAWVVRESKANIVSILEIPWGARDNVGNKLIAAIRAVSIAKDKPWRGISVNSQKKEAYVVLYQEGNKFAPLTDKKTKQPIIDLTAEARVNGGSTLRFNSPGAAYGGRKPCYVAFQTDTEKKFTIVAHHVMFGSKKRGVEQVGVRNVGLVAQNQNILYGGVVVSLAASLTAGDFNVNFDAFSPGAYDNLLAIPSKQATIEETTLKKDTPPEKLPFAYMYRANAYDNIFQYKTNDPPLVANGKVFDLIKDSTVKDKGTIQDKGTGLLSKQIGDFKRGTIENGKAIQNIPPQDFEDSWHIVRHAISDHLPVYVSLTI